MFTLSNQIRVANFFRIICDTKIKHQNNKIENYIIGINLIYKEDVLCWSTVFVGGFQQIFSHLAPLKPREFDNSSQLQYDTSRRHKWEKLLFTTISQLHMASLKQILPFMFEQSIYFKSWWQQHARNNFHKISIISQKG